MPSKIVLITWDEPEDKNWLSEDNIVVALNAYCQNTHFEVYPEAAIAYSNDAVELLNTAKDLMEWLDMGRVVSPSFSEVFALRQAISHYEMNNPTVKNMEPKDLDDAVYLARVWQRVRNDGWDFLKLYGDIDGIDFVADRILSKRPEQKQPDNNPVTRDWSGDEEDNAWQSLSKK